MATEQANQQWKMGDRACTSSSQRRRIRKNGNNDVVGGVDDNDNDDLPPLTSFKIFVDASTRSTESHNSNSCATARSATSSEAAQQLKIVLTEESVRAHLYDFYDDLNSNKDFKVPEIWRVLYEKYHSPGYVLIRPSGNSISSEEFVDMHCSRDVQVLKMALVSVDSIQLIAGGLSAVATYTVDQHFSYKGTYNEDRCVVTCVLEQYKGDVKIAHEHRTSGHPIPKQTRWNAD